MDVIDMCMDAVFFMDEMNIGYDVFLIYISMNEYIYIIYIYMFFCLFGICHLVYSSCVLLTCLIN